MKGHISEIPDHLTCLLSRAYNLNTEIFITCTLGPPSPESQEVKKKKYYHIALFFFLSIQ